MRHEDMHQQLTINTHHGVLTQLLTQLAKAEQGQEALTICLDEQWSVQEIAATFAELIFGAGPEPEGLRRRSRPSADSAALSQVVRRGQQPGAAGSHSRGHAPGPRGRDHGDRRIQSANELSDNTGGTGRRRCGNMRAELPDELPEPHDANDWSGRWQAPASTNCFVLRRRIHRQTPIPRQGAAQRMARLPETISRRAGSVVIAPPDTLASQAERVMARFLGAEGGGGVGSLLAKYSPRVRGLA